jgi:ankyrin repeat protein
MFIARNKRQQVHYGAYTLFCCIAALLLISQGACQCKPRPSSLRPPIAPKKNTEVTDEMISKAKSASYPFLADYLQKLQNGESPDINARDTNPYEKGQTIVMQAAMLGDLAIFNLILKQNPDLNATDSINHRPAITFAIHFGHLDIVNILLQRGVDLTIKSDYPAHEPPSAGSTPLAFATSRYNYEKGLRNSKKGIYKAIIDALKAKAAPL